MKSPKATQYLNERANVFYDNRLKVTQYDARKAVDLAEQDALERAIDAFKTTCEWYDDGRDVCWRCPTDPQRKCDRKYCDDFDKFFKRYDNE